MKKFTVLEEIIGEASKLGFRPIDLIHKILFLSFVNAGLALTSVAESPRKELENLISMIPPPYRGLASGKLYLHALKFLKTLKGLFESYVKAPVILQEANVNFILDFLRKEVGKVDGVVVLDCGSIPEISTIAAVFHHLGRDFVVYDKVFANPVGITRFLTEQLTSDGLHATLRHYVRLLRKELGARFGIKISTIDFLVHQHGVSVKDFLNSLDMKTIFEEINRLARQGSILITADHGYDVVADEHGLYVTHGYSGDCPLNFSKVAFFLVID